ncbi:hypothetical protein GQ457_13G006210 [Hibiscus cannabinus]
MLKLRPVLQVLVPSRVSTVRRIWDEIREPRSKVRRHRLVWFGFNVPRHSVVLWMSILNRLPTFDRLQGMGMILENHCILCEAGAESRNHLFADCLFSRHIWNSILGMCGLTRRMLDWEGELNWLCTCLKGKSLIVFILRLAWCSYVYFIWEERNHRRYRGHSRDCNSVLACVKEVVNTRVQKKSIRLDTVNSNLCAVWGIP